MSSAATTVIYPVKDLDAAKAVFTALLGAPPATDAPYYVGWEVDGQKIGLDPHGHAQGRTGPVAFWDVPDIEATIGSLVAAGASVTEPAKDVGGGMQVAVLSDADGNPIGLTQPGSWG